MGVSEGQVIVGVDVGVAVGVRLGVGLGDETGILLLGLTWNRPRVTIDFFSVGEEIQITSTSKILFCMYCMSLFQLFFLFAPRITFWYCNTTILRACSKLQ